MALTEDLGTVGDLTSGACIPTAALGSARFIARQDGVLCGMPIVAMLAERFGLAIRGVFSEDGVFLERDTTIGAVHGPMRSMLAFERTALNFVQHLSGIATLTAHFVAAVSGTHAGIFDTRKTLPGWRVLEKYAVRTGGGRNHRMGLFDAVLIKDNHLAFLSDQADPVSASVATARARAPAHTVVEVEVATLPQLESALAASPDIVLLDNMDLATMAEAVRLRDARAPEVELEASGGVTLQTVAAIARTGVERISVGALTHSAPAVDIALEVGD
jgi:nicotinate-nucleotide pyrophosphorylase (carboxylating)